MFHSKTQPTQHDANGTRQAARNTGTHAKTYRTVQTNRGSKTIP